MPLAHKIEKLPKTEMGLKIHEEIQQPVIRALSRFFDDTEQAPLATLIRGDTIKGKICFQENSNRFVMVFRQLHLNQKITSTYVATQRWICHYFDYQNNIYGRSDFSAFSVYRILISTTSSLPKEKRIHIENLDFILTKRRNLNEPLIQLRKK